MLGKLWQHPFVNVFKEVDVESWRRAERVGDVKLIVDRTIGRKTFCILGAVPAASSLSIPTPRTLSLGLTGRFLYMEFRVIEHAFFVIHLDLMTKEHMTIRFSFSNLYREKRTLGTVVQLPCDAMGGKWAVVALDAEKLMNEHVKRAYGGLKAVRFCANLVVRAMFTSDNVYDSMSLPRDMAFPLRDRSVPWETLYRWRWFPEVPSSSHNATAETSEVHENLPPSTKAPLRGGSHRRLQTRRLCSASSLLSEAAVSWSSMSGINELKSMDTSNLLVLDRVMGFNTVSNIIANHDTTSLIYPCGSVVVVLESGCVPQVQRHLLGHTAPVCRIAVHEKRDILATGQTGKDPVIRLWRMSTGQCLIVLQAHTDTIQALTFSADGEYLCGVGGDGKGHHRIVVWDTSHLHAPSASGASVKILARQQCDYDIRAMSFSCFVGDNQLVSCGDKSVRFWRLKSGQLRSQSPEMNSYGKDVFSALAFHTASSQERHVLLTTLSGLVYIVDYNERVLSRVVQLNCGTLTSIATTHNAIVTGSNDSKIRVWDTHLSDVFMDVDVNGIPSCTTTSENDRRVVVSTKAGTLGVLDLVDCKYKILARSHSNRIVDLAVSHYERRIATVSHDATIRVWDVDTGDELYEFQTSTDTPICVTFHPSLPLLAVGFSSGSLRILEIPPTRVIEERKEHTGGIQKISYDQEGKYLFLAGSDGKISVFDAEHNYSLLRFIQIDEIELCHKPLRARFSPDRRLLVAAEVPEGRIRIFSTLSLEPLANIECEEMGDMWFTPNGKELLVSTQHFTIQRFATDDGRSVGELNGLHTSSRPLRDLCVCPAGDAIATCSNADGRVRLWELDWNSRKPEYLRTQTFIGHCDSPSRLHFTPDASLLLTLGEMEGVYAWKYMGNRRIEYDHTEIQQNEEEELPSEAVSISPPPSEEAQVLSGLPAIHYRSGPAPLPFPEDLRCASDFQGTHLRMMHVCGFNSDAHANTRWQPEMGLLVYSIGCLAVIEHLRRQEQIHLVGHTQDISVLTTSTDGTIIASGAGLPEEMGMASIRLWDCQSGRCLHVLSSRAHGIQALDISPDRHLLVSIGTSHKAPLVVWNVDSGEALEAVDLCSFIHDVKWYPHDPRRFLTIGGYSVGCWTVEPDCSLNAEQHDLTSIPDQAVLTSLAYLPDESVLLGTSGGDVLMYDQADSAATFCFTASNEEIDHICVAGERVITGGQAKMIRAWSLHRAENEVSLMEQVELDGGTKAFVFDKEGKEGVVGTSSGTIWHVSLKNQTAVRLVAGHRGFVRSVSFDPHGCYWLSGGDDGTMRVWAAELHEQIIQFAAPNVHCSAVEFSPDVCWCAAGFSDGTVRLYTLDGSRRRVHYCETPDDPVTSILYMRNGHTVLSGHASGKLVVTDVSSKNLCHALVGEHVGSAIDCLERSPSNDMLWLTGSRDGKITVWTLLGSGGCQVLEEWHMPRCEMHETIPTCAVFSSSDSEVLVCAARQEQEGPSLLFFNFFQGKVVATIPLPRCPTALAISSDGLYIALGSNDRVITLVNCVSSTMHDYAYHSDTVLSLVFAPHPSSTLLSASRGEVIVWKVAMG